MGDRERFLPPGKLPGDLLGDLLSRYIVRDPSVIIGPGIGQDAAAIRIGEYAIVVKTDPITFATEDAGRYLVNVNANDIACMGAVPRWFLVTALYPERTTTPAMVEEAFESIATAAHELGIALVGGHTEITIGIDRLIQVGQMIGICDPEDLLSLSDAQAGDAVILASGIAIEGTAILAREARERLEARVSFDIMQSAANLLSTPGISVLPAIDALKSAGVIIRGMHDPTEGGIATALAELATASGLGIEIDERAIPIRPETAVICDALDLDPLGLIASGALLAVVAPESADAAVDALAAAGIQGARIGTMLPEPDERWMLTEGRRVPLPVFPVDEIARFFAS